MPPDPDTSAEVLMGGVCYTIRITPGAHQNVAAPNMAGAVTPEFPKKWKKTAEKPEFQTPENRKRPDKAEFGIWTLENRKRRKTRKRRKVRLCAKPKEKRGK